MNRLKYLVTVALIAGASVSCSKDNPGGDTPSTGGGAPKTTSSDYAVVKLTESSINGTAIQSTSTVAGLVTDKSTGKGIAGVPVTDGYHFVVTDANGVYQMQANAKCRKVYYTTPAAYKVNLDSKNHLPCFFSQGVMCDYIKTNGRCRVDFSLEALNAVETEFTLVMIGDPQCETVTEAARYKKETVADIVTTAGKGTYRNMYAITLGDITHDSTNNWGNMVTSMSNVQGGGGYIPFFQCIGNHDHNSLVTYTGNRDTDDYNATAKYVEMMGPTDYSFDRGNAHIIVMDDIYVSTQSSSSRANGKTWNYNSNATYTDAQYTWLCEDLANVKDKANKVAIICNHIQYRSATAGHVADVLSQLSQFKEAHVMIGHTHYPQNYIHTYKCKGGQAVYEHIHGAACGAWWAANSNVTGAPNGYSLYSFNGANVTDWVAKGTKNDESYQLRVYDGNQTYTGSKQIKFNWYNTANKCGSNFSAVGYADTKDCFVAEVWDDDFENWKVEFWQNGVKAGDFTHIPNAKCANIAICAYWFNEKGKTTDTWVSKTASHYWYYKPKSGTPDSQTNWEVRAVQVIPTNKAKTHTYKCTKLTKDYSEF